MIELNLHPWRQELREKRKKDFLNILTLTVFLFFVFAFLFQQFLNQKITNQNFRNNFLLEQNTIYQKDIDLINDLKKEKEDIINRMFVINSLQIDRPKVVQLFDEVVETLPKELFLRNLSRVDSVIKFEGVSYSNNNTSVFIENLQKSDIFKNPKLERINAIEGTNVLGQNIFHITAEENFNEKVNIIMD